MTKALPRRTRFAIIITWIGLWSEQLIRAFWPVISLAFLAVGIAFLFDPTFWPVELLWFAAAGLVVGAAAGLWYALRHFQWPQKADALARVDAALPGRPLQAMADQQAIARDDPGAQAVWAAHVARMADRAAGAKPVEPDLRIAARDPYALRYIALMIGIVGLAFGSAAAVRDVRMAPGAPLATGPAWEGWVRPPAYTRKPNVYLNDMVGQNITVPQGSEVILRLYGEPGSVTVAETVSARTAIEGSVADESQSFTIAQSGRLELRGEQGAIWSITSTPDKAPEVQLTARFEVDDTDQISQRFLARDDYGITQGRAFVSLMLDEVDRVYGLAADPLPRPPFELQLPLTITGDRRNFEEVLNEDLSKNPWVDLPVQIVLEVEDIAGQTGRSAIVDTQLPGRRFFDPLAKALIEQRRDILWTPGNADRVANVLRAVSLTPETVFRDEADNDSVRGIIADLEAAEMLSPEAADEIAEALWQLALKIEEGDLADAQEALRRAQEKLEEAIRNGASPSEIQRLMDELRQAQRDYMREFAERNPIEPTERGEQVEGQQDNTVSQSELEEMMQRLQELMEEGRMAEAQDLLEEINRLMENLQMTEGQGGEGQPSEGQEAMEGLSDTLRQQQQLSDDAFRDLQEGQPQDGQPGQNQGSQQGQNQGQQPGTGQNQQPGQGQGQAEGQTPSQTPGQTPGQSLAERQEALRNLLEQQRRGLPAPGNEAGDAAREALDEAGRAMGRAEEDLRDGDIPGAIDNQSQAMEALREGMRNLGRSLAQDQQQQNQGSAQQQAEGQGGQFDQVDPLGRNNTLSPNQNGPNEDMLTQEDLRKRSQDLMDEIQRRGAELERPEAERNYLDRLIDQF